MCATVHEMVALSVNGSLVETAADPDTALLYVLRNDLGLKGSRFGCGDGLCGACAVLIDGVPTPSCDIPVSAIGERDVVTIEGLGDEARPHPLQRAVIDCQAAQCGYCLTGVVIHGAALLEDNRRPSREEIRAALQGVLCRCGAHQRMIRAVEEAAEAMRAAG